MQQQQRQGGRNLRGFTGRGLATPQGSSSSEGSHSARPSSRRSATRLPYLHAGGAGSSHVLSQVGFPESSIVPGLPLLTLLSAKGVDQLLWAVHCNEDASAPQPCLLYLTLTCLTATVRQLLMPALAKVLFANAWLHRADKDCLPVRRIAAPSTLPDCLLAPIGAKPLSSAVSAPAAGRP